MKTTSIWLIKLALAVQFACVLAVPTIVAASESPRALWMAEWIRPSAPDRTIGILTLREGKLSFAEQVGGADWSLDIASIDHLAPASAGKALSIVLTTGETYVVTVMDPALMPTSQKKLAATLDRAMQLLSAGTR